MNSFEIGARDGAARAGVLHTAHGDVRTPAFVPLASHATVRGLQSSEVAALGFEMVLGNTFHLFIRPGHERIAKLGGLHEFMGWERPIITDSGGFQVFSMGHGGVAEEIKASGGSRGQGHGSVLEIAEEGVRFRSYLGGEEKFMGPETSMGIQQALGSDVVLAFDECTPFHAGRDYTAGATERTHRWLERCLRWREENAAGGLFYGIVQGGTWEDLRSASAQRVAGSSIDGIAVGGSLGQDKDQIREVVGWTLRELPETLPRHLLGIGDVDDIVAAVAQGIDTFDCATPTRLARHGTALVPDPGARWRLDLKKPSEQDSAEPIAADCPCPACTDHTRAYIHYLARAGELTAVRLLVLHNLTFMHALMETLRAGVGSGNLEARGEAILAGDSPYDICPD
ncbi:MAG: tRNA guanosine(34) transglycosylase Tgt [Thermoleophilaceae bacterium]|nr:tRNA guanosine(34) transglycosylase Tgt [Thermoleophilaceae bacterium]